MINIKSKVKISCTLTRGRFIIYVEWSTCKWSGTQEGVYSTLATRRARSNTHRRAEDAEPRTNWSSFDNIYWVNLSFKITLYDFLIVARFQQRERQSFF